MSERTPANPLRPEIDGVESTSCGSAGEDSAARGEAGPFLWTADGIPLATRWWTSGHSVRGVVVLVHGLAGNKDDPRIALLATELHARELDVIAYDARGHGRSGGRCTLGHQEHHDVAAVASWARSRSPHVLLIGASLGAVAALAYAATTRDLTGVVAVSSPADWRLPLRPRSLLTAALARTAIGRAFADRRMNVRIARWSSPESPRSLVERVTCPLVAVHGQRDPIIPHTMGLGTLFHGDPRRSALLVRNMGHAFDPLSIEPICEALEWTIELDHHRGERLDGVRTPGTSRSGNDAIRGSKTVAAQRAG